jgi:hypothetical protein
MITALIIITLLGAAGCGPKKNYDGFAKCLSVHNVTMYGAAWCPHCQNVKKDFGNAFRFINYIECDDQTLGAEPEKCTAAGVEYLPTFQFSDGKKLFGEVSFDILSQKTGCVLP